MAVIIAIVIGPSLIYFSVLVGAGLGIDASVYTGGAIREDAALVGGTIVGSAAGVLATGLLAIGAARVSRSLFH